MATLTVNINDEQEERGLLAFLNSLKYNYSMQPEELSDLQKEEILCREADCNSGKITAEPWEEVRKRFFH